MYKNCLYDSCKFANSYFCTKAAKFQFTSQVGVHLEAEIANHFVVEVHNIQFLSDFRK